MYSTDKISSFFVQLHLTVLSLTHHALLLSTDVDMRTTTMMATEVGSLIGGPIETQRQTTGGGVDPLAQPIRTQQRERSLQ